LQTVKSAAFGRELEILRNVCGIDGELLDGKHHACPKCGGFDRFRCMAERDGKPLWCNNCFHENNGDVISAVQWMRDCDFSEALRLIGDYLGINPVGDNRYSIPAKVTKAVTKPVTRSPKPKSELLRTIRYEYLSGVGDYHVLVERLEFADGTKSFRQSHWSIEQGRHVTGTKGMVAVPWDAPSFKEASTIYWCEGEKKAIALSEVMAEHRPDICCSTKWGGSNNFPPELVTWFCGKDVVIFADNDLKGENYARMVALAIRGTVKSVKIVSFHECAAKFDIADWLQTESGVAA